MSKAHAKATDTTAQEATAQAPRASTDTGAAPVVQSSPPAQAAAPATDEFHGQGGLYTMKDGRRVLIEKTQAETTETAKERT